MMSIKKTRLIGIFRHLLLFFTVATGLIILISGCGSESGEEAKDSGEAKTGTLYIGLTDAADGYQAVYVTINDVQVHMSGGDWEVVGSPGKTYNLLELVNGIIEQLGIKQLEAGDYTQVRLNIGEVPDDGMNILGLPHPFANYIIDTADHVYELKVPSGMKTGIKLVHGFTINEGAIVELILDFNACKSVVKAGDSGQWLLKPTIKVIDWEESYTISGIVSGVTENPLTSVLVSAQIYDDSAADKKDKVIIQASTITDENGEYYMLVEAGAYNIVAYKDGYNPACANILVESGSGGPEPKDFTLNAASTGTVSGNVTISGGDSGASAILSFRQDIQCDGLDAKETIEIKSLHLSAGSFSDIILPVGTYALVASSEGKTTQEISPIIITDGGTTVVPDIIF